MRAIHLFPAFPNSKPINALRAKYDPLSTLIPPHVTLVFPFESMITADELQAHLKESIAGLKPFNIVMRGVTGADEEYLFLNVKVGNDEIIQLHDKLYTRILRQHLNRSLTYIPHLTVGRIKDKRGFHLALQGTEGFNETFEAIVHEIIVESIDENGMSITELKMPLSHYNYSGSSL